MSGKSKDVYGGYSSKQTSLKGNDMLVKVDYMCCLLKYPLGNGYLSTDEERRHDQFSLLLLLPFNFYCLSLKIQII